MHITLDIDFTIRGKKRPICIHLFWMGPEKDFVFGKCVSEDLADSYIEKRVIKVFSVFFYISFFVFLSVYTSGSQPVCRGTLVCCELLPSLPPIYFPITFTWGKIEKHNQNCVHQPRVCKIFLVFGVPPIFFDANCAANLKRLRIIGLYQLQEKGIFSIAIKCLLKINPWRKYRFAAATVLNQYVQQFMWMFCCNCTSQPSNDPIKCSYNIVYHSDINKLRKVSSKL